MVTAARQVPVARSAPPNAGILPLISGLRVAQPVIERQHGLLHHLDRTSSMPAGAKVVFRLGMSRQPMRLYQDRARAFPSSTQRVASPKREVRSLRCRAVCRPLGPSGRGRRKDGRGARQKADPDRGQRERHRRCCRPEFSLRAHGARGRSPLRANATEAGRPRTLGWARREERYGQTLEVQPDDGGP